MTKYTAETQNKTVEGKKIEIYQMIISQMNIASEPNRLLGCLKHEKEGN